MAERSRGERSATPPSGKDGIGGRLAAERRQVEISVRELARRAAVTPSLVSQIENGKVSPSVGTLYALAGALDIPVERFFISASAATPAPAVPSDEDEAVASSSLTETPSVKPLSELVVARGARRAIELAGGVRWELVRPPEEAASENLEILDVSYRPGSASASELIRHRGREYGLVLEGELTVEVGSERANLGPGESVAFDSTRPHRLSNDGSEPVRAIWVVIGRAGG